MAWSDLTEIGFTVPVIAKTPKENTNIIVFSMNVGLVEREESLEGGSEIIQDGDELFSSLALAVYGVLLSGVFLF